MCRRARAHAYLNLCSPSPQASLRSHPHRKPRFAFTLTPSLVLLLPSPKASLRSHPHPKPRFALTLTPSLALLSLSPQAPLCSHPHPKPRFALTLSLALLSPRVSHQGEPSDTSNVSINIAEVPNQQHSGENPCNLARVPFFQLTGKLLLNVLDNTCHL